MAKNNHSTVEERIRKGAEQASQTIATEAEQAGTAHDETLETIKKELAHKTVTLEEYTTTLKRLQAEFENYTKRVDKERKDYALYATENLIIKLLATLDSFEQALTNVKDENHKQGIQLLFDQVRSTLEREGLERIETLNKQFNTEEHEALLLKESEEPEHSIIEVLQTGYKLKEKVIRPAKVILSKQQQEKHSTNTPEQKNKHVGGN